MLLNILIASLIPFVVWIIQKLAGKTGPKATYIRRRIFAYGLLFIFLLSIFDFYLIYQKIQEDTQSVNALSRYFLRVIIFWALAFWYGFKNEPNEDKGFIYSLWQPFKAKYVVDQKKVSKSQKKVLKNNPPEFLSDENKEGWLIDKKNIWCKRFYLENNPNADLKQYVVEQTGKLIPNQPPEITKELKLKIKEAKSDWKYYINNGWLPTDKKWD